MQNNQSYIKTVKTKTQKEAFKPAGKQVKGKAWTRQDKRASAPYNQFWMSA